MGQDQVKRAMPVPITTLQDHGERKAVVQPWNEPATIVAQGKGRTRMDWRPQQEELYH